MAGKSARETHALAHARLSLVAGPYLVDAIGAGDLKHVLQKLCAARWEVDKAWKKPE